MALRTTLMVIVLVGASFVGEQNARANQATGLEMCPGYRQALQVAQGALVRGERDAAVSALQRAKAALENCRREEARKTSLLAAIRPHCGRAFPLGA